MTDSIQNAIRNSALLAAYGDALGFITELTDESGLRRRAKTTRVSTTIPWIRQVGGRFGASITMPAGTYSDDTQLRLATCRAIRGDGKFDVEAFAKIELPVWRTYALGAGRGTKTAANRLIQTDVNWFSNFFSDPVSYLESGGNGAAMRIQPHVWATRDWSSSKLLIDVIKNSICTHGHPRGIIGAVFHARCLAFALEKRVIPNPDEWFKILSASGNAIDAIYQDGDLAAFWVPTWESKSKLGLGHGFESVFKECENWLYMIGQFLRRYQGDVESEKVYRMLVEEMGGLSENWRGTGTLTAILALALAWMFRKDPFHGLTVAANVINSDTDTITTMAGALLGAVSPIVPDAAIQDRHYIELEADRLYKIGQGKVSESFRYPDLMNWRPPKTQIEAVMETKGGFELSAFGRAVPIGSEIAPRTKADYVFQWMSLSFGQTVLTKHHRVNSQEKAGRELTKAARVSVDAGSRVTAPQTSLFPHEGKSTPSLGRTALLDEKTSEAIRCGFRSDIVGQHILELVSLPDGIELAIGYVAIIAKAKRAREVNGRNRN